MDFIMDGQAHGPVASRLLANGFNVGALRPWVNSKNQGVVTVNGQNFFNASGTLRKDEWKLMDEAVLRVQRQRLVGIADLQSAGLTYSLNGMGTTVLQHELIGDSMEAQLTMDGTTHGKRDRPTYDIGYLPLPIISADFQLNARVLAASRNGSTPLDTTMVEHATRKVIEKAETMLFNGASSYAFGGGTIYGYTDFPSRNLYTLHAHWNDSAATGETVVDDVNQMMQASINDNFYGPWGLYIPKNFQTAVNEDYKAASDKSVRQRLLELDGLSFVKVADYLTADNVVLVSMMSETVRLVNGLAITTVQWSEEGGMLMNFKVMCIMVPQMRADIDGRCGIVHGSK